MESSVFASIDEESRRRFESAWKEGRPRPIEEFLPPADQPNFLPTLEELVHIELELAWEKWSQPAAVDQATLAHPPLLEDYLERFPPLRDKAVLGRLLRQEFRVRQQYGDKPSPRDYLARFPDFQLEGQAVETWLFGAEVTVLEKKPGSARTSALPEIPGYDILEVLGRGGMAVVYKARHRNLQRVVALKMIRGGAGDSGEVARFRTEAEAVARLQHPNIVQIFEVGEHAGEPFISLEFVNGGSLAGHIKKQPVAPRLAAQLVASLARATHYAHEHGIVHRDLKPANILLQISDVRLQIEKPNLQSRSPICNLQSRR